MTNFTAAQKDLIQTMQKKPGLSIACNKQTGENVLRDKNKNPIKNLRTKTVQSLLDLGFLATSFDAPKTLGLVLSVQGQGYKRKIGRPALTA